MAKVIWRANQVISIETKRKDESRKENVYVLAQMINKAQLLVFNLFNNEKVLVRKCVGDTFKSDL